MALLPTPFQTILHNDIKQKVNFYFFGVHETQAWCHVSLLSPQSSKQPQNCTAIVPMVQNGEARPEGLKMLRQNV